MDSFYAFVNGPQALYVNPGCIKCISGIHLFHASKFIPEMHLRQPGVTLYSFYISKHKRGPIKRNLLADVFIPKLLHNPLAFCC